MRIRFCLQLLVTLTFFTNSNAQEIIQMENITIDSSTITCCETSKACCSEACCDYNYGGLALSFYVADIASRPFSVSNVLVNGDTKYRVVPEERSDLELGAGFVMRYGRKVLPEKLGCMFGVHLNIGPGISISPKPRPRLITGVGITIGQNNNFSIDFGAISGHVDVLSNSVDLNERYDTIPTTLMSSKLTTKAYAALSYRICL